MFGFMRSPGNKASKSSESDTESGMKPSRRTSSEPVLNVPDIDGGWKGSSSSATYKNDFADSGGLENQSVQELEKYAVYKAEETTKSVNNCLKIAEDIRGDANRTLDMLHQQGEQINRTHMMAAEMDKDISKVLKCNSATLAYQVGILKWLRSLSFCS